LGVQELEAGQKGRANRKRKCRRSACQKLTDRNGRAKDGGGTFSIGRVKKGAHRPIMRKSTQKKKPGMKEGKTEHGGDPEGREPGPIPKKKINERQESLKGKNGSKGFRHGTKYSDKLCGSRLSDKKQTEKIHIHHRKVRSTPSNRQQRKSTQKKRGSKDPGKERKLTVAWSKSHRGCF